MRTAHSHRSPARAVARTFLRVELLEDRTVPASVFPTDAGFQSLWGLHNTGQTGGKPDADIDAPEAWAVTTGSTGVTVAVIDTGIETKHPDLKGRVAKTENFVDGGAQSFAQDRHGTAVAGVIGARANNNEGIFGVAPGADLLGIKACWHSTAGGLEARCSSWTLAKAIDFAVINGTRVINLSLGGPPDPLLTRLIAKAIERGATVVAPSMAAATTVAWPVIRTTTCRAATAIARRCWPRRAWRSSPRHRRTRTPSFPERPWPPLTSRASSRSSSSGSRGCRPARFASCCSRRPAP